MKNPLTAKDVDVKSVLIILWIIFSVIFVLKSLWQMGVGYSYQVGLQNGQTAAVSEIIKRTASACEPINLFVGEGASKVEVNLLNVACLQKPEGAAAESAE